MLARLCGTAIGVKRSHFVRRANVTDARKNATDQFSCWTNIGIPYPAKKQPVSASAELLVGCWLAGRCTNFGRTLLASASSSPVAKREAA
jgi:hypothetical protein